jgi:hypothetical protein
MTDDQLSDIFNCGTPHQHKVALVQHFKQRAAQSREIARDLERDAKDALEQSSEHAEAGRLFDLMATTIEKLGSLVPDDARASVTGEGGGK